MRQRGRRLETKSDLQKRGIHAVCHWLGKLLALWKDGKTGNRREERLIVNVGIVLVFAAFYLRFLKSP